MKKWWPVAVVIVMAPLLALLGVVVSVMLIFSTQSALCADQNATVNSTQVVIDGDKVTVNGKPPTQEQRLIAQEIIGQGRKRGLSDKDIITAISTGYQESGLRNLNYGDRDSVGVFQQRPSQGWGTRAQILHVPYAVDKFYDALVKIENRDQKTIQAVAEAVQRPAEGAYNSPRNRFSNWLPLATALLGKVVNNVLIDRLGTTDAECNVAQALGKAPTGKSGSSFASIGSCPAGVKAGVGTIPSGRQIQLCSINGVVVEAGVSKQVAEMFAAASRDGIVLTGSGYRSYQRQIELRKQNCGTSEYAIYRMPSMECSPPTAKPGTSNHELGHAMDLRSNGGPMRVGGAGHTWLQNNAPSYGVTPFAAEPWHWNIRPRAP